MILKDGLQEDGQERVCKCPRQGLRVPVPTHNASRRPMPVFLTKGRALHSTPQEGMLINTRTTA